METYERGEEEESRAVSSSSRLHLALDMFAARRAFSSSCRRAEHFLNATPAIFDKVVIAEGGDRVVLVDFFAEYVRSPLRRPD